MRRYRSGADLRQHLPGCAVCTSLCAVRSGQEAGGDRRSEDEPPNRSPKRANHRLIGRWHIATPLLRSHYSILFVVCQRVCRKVFGFFLLFSLSVV